MNAGRKAPANIDDYIAAFPPEIQAILEKIRATIRKAAPDAVETISYQIPTFTLCGNLVHFAAFKNHIGFYPPVRSDEKFATRRRSMQMKRATCGFRSTNAFPMR